MYSHNSAWNRPGTDIPLSKQSFLKCEGSLPSLTYAHCCSTILSSSRTSTIKSNAMLCPYSSLVLEGNFRSFTLFDQTLWVPVSVVSKIPNLASMYSLSHWYVFSLFIFVSFVCQSLGAEAPGWWFLGNYVSFHVIHPLTAHYHGRAFSLLAANNPPVRVVTKTTAHFLTEFVERYT